MVPATATVASSAFAHRPAARRVAASCWPREMLNAFSLGMAGFGLSVSGILMRDDPSYALNQIRQACDLPDTGLQDLALSMFRLFEQERSGIVHMA
jgi:hypothetical protein